MGEGLTWHKFGLPAKSAADWVYMGMEERASLVGGRLTIESAPGSGTTVVVEVPL